MSRKPALSKQDISEIREVFVEDMVPKDTKWKPGQSGNPNGRSSEPDDLIELMRYHLGKAGAAAVVKNWINIAKGIGDGSHPVPYNVQLSAAEGLYDRLIGKPRQAPAANGEDEPVIVKILKGLISDDSALTGRELPAGAKQSSYTIAEVTVPQDTR